jgi:hypothetical protein
LGRPEHTDAGPLFRGVAVLVERPDRDKDIDVYISGLQRPSGRVEREIVLHLDGDDAITAEQARQLGAALIAAADEAEDLAGYDQT